MKGFVDTDIQEKLAAISTAANELANKLAEIRGAHRGGSGSLVKPLSAQVQSNFMTLQMLASDLESNPLLLSITFARNPQKKQALLHELQQFLVLINSTKESLGENEFDEAYFIRELNRFSKELGVKYLSEAQYLMWLGILVTLSLGTAELFILPWNRFWYGKWSPYLNEASHQAQSDEKTLAPNFDQFSRDIENFGNSVAKLCNQLDFKKNEDDATIISLEEVARDLKQLLCFVGWRRLLLNAFSSDQELKEIHQKIIDLNRVVTQFNQNTYCELKVNSDSSMSVDAPNRIFNVSFLPSDSKITDYQTDMSREYTFLQPSELYSKLESFEHNKLIALRLADLSFIETQLEIIHERSLKHQVEYLKKQVEGLQTDINGRCTAVMNKVPGKLLCVFMHVLFYLATLMVTAPFVLLGNKMRHDTWSLSLPLLFASNASLEEKKGGSSDPTTPIYS